MSTAAVPQQQKLPQTIYRGLVKSIVSGDCVIIKSLVPGKNLEKRVILTSISAARLGRQIGGNSVDATIEPDAPYAFEAREFLRKKLIGKEVCFVKDVNSQQMDRGVLFLGKDATGECINDALISAGLVEVRRLNKPSEEEARLVALEDAAKAAKLGRWSGDADSRHVRAMKYTVENAINFVNSFRNKPQDAIVEYIRDASTVRLLLLPSYQTVTCQMSGIRAPGFKREGADNVEVGEPFAEEARQFVEARLLQRDVKVILEGVASQTASILLGSIQHPNGSIAELLLREGLAKCVDSTMGVVTGGAEKYRASEKFAKQHKLRIWKNYTASAATDISQRHIAGKVILVLNGDGIVVKMQDGTQKKLFLSSVRPPRANDFPEFTANKTDRKNNPLYDVPYLFEAREFLRKRLIGKKVQCTVDYIQPKQDGYPEKVAATVMVGEVNIAEAIVAQGLARVIRHRQDDDQRSSKYDDLLAAESRAQKKGAGVHSSKDPSTIKINDVTSDTSRAKQMLPFLQRAGKIDALCEFVSSGSRIKLYLPKETCVITFLLGGIDCPRLGRPEQGQASDEFGDEAYEYTKSLVMQRDVRIEVESMDKKGNFIGQCIASDDNTNLSVGLVEQGFAAVYKSRDGGNSSFVSALNAAEFKAKEKKLCRWANFVEVDKVAADVAKNEPKERVVNQKKLIITEVTDELHFYGQLIENGPKLEQLTNQLRAEIEARPPVAGSYTPKVGELCVAKFSMDDEWYRAKVLSVDRKDSRVVVLFIDYGNKETTKATSLAAMPAGFDSLAPQANEYALGLVQLSPDEEDNELAVDYFKSLVMGEEDAQFSINTEYKAGTLEYVTLLNSQKEDLGKLLVNQGYVSVDKARREQRLQRMLTDYMKALNLAKQSHKVMWRYGDKEQDDAAEFGFAARK